MRGGRGARGVGGVLTLLVGALWLAGCAHRPEYRPTQSPVPLEETRRRFPFHDGPRAKPVPDAYKKIDDHPPDGVRVVHYRSEGRELVAWLAEPRGPGPHPAVLWAHGGFGLDAKYYADIRPFVDAGFVLLMPAWRAENGNSGRFEMVDGEVSDALAALDTLAKRPGVDPKRLFMAGHSLGGTTTFLTAELSTRLRAAAACGAFPDMAWSAANNDTKDFEPIFELAPFDWHDPNEVVLRSPARFLRDLKCPLLLYYGPIDDQPFVDQAKRLPDAARRLGAPPITVTVLNGKDHFSSVAPAVHDMIARFKATDADRSNRR